VLLVSCVQTDSQAAGDSITKDLEELEKEMEANMKELNKDLDEIHKAVDDKIESFK
tara:strand:- start:9361 stop:9528 length:168 start_codon:yes stop_codon:yes gene_type:complete